MDAAQSQNTQADSRSAALARQCSALEIQLTEAQQAAQGDAQHQAELHAQLRTVESHAAGLREQLDEQTEAVQQQEAKIQTQNAQVGYHVKLSVYSVHEFLVSNQLPSDLCKRNTIVNCYLLSFCGTLKRVLAFRWSITKWQIGCR